MSETLTEIVLPGVVEPDGLIVQHRPIPTAGDGEVLVEMRATGVSFAEQGMRRNRYPGQPKFPFVLGYDLVGDISAVGHGVDPSLLGQRIAAVTKTGAWATHVVLDARDVVPVPEGADSAEVETLVVNGITAWQMLHRKARVKTGETILVHGASGGVGTTLVQLARASGIRVIGTASPRHHEALRELGVEPLDYNDPRLSDRVRELEPDGVAAAFDHLGGESFRRSFDLLASGGTLVAYGTASQRDDANNLLATFLGIFARLSLWSMLPNGRKALFYNFWGGKIVRPERFRRHLSSDLRSVLTLLARGAVKPQVAARIPLADAAEAMTLAESRTVYGKVVLVP